MQISENQSITEETQMLTSSFQSLSGDFSTLFKMLWNPRLLLSVVVWRPVPGLCLLAPFPWPSSSDLVGTNFSATLAFVLGAVFLSIIFTLKSPGSSWSEYSLSVKNTLRMRQFAWIWREKSRNGKQIHVTMVPPIKSANSYLYLWRLHVFGSK